MRRQAWLIVPLALTLAACNRQFDAKDFSPTAPPFQSALTLTAAAAAIPADSSSTVALTAQITPEADPIARSIVFTTDAGTLVGAAAGEPTTRTIQVDAQGRATVELRSSTRIETATVEASVKDVVGLVKRTTVEFVQADPATVVRIGAGAGSGEADGASRIAVFADVSAAIPADRRQVTFTTSLGSFAQTGNATATATPDAGNRATVDLVAPGTVGTARLTATVNGFSVQTSIAFGPAFPDAVVVTLNPTTLQQGGGGTSAIAVTVARLPGRGTVTDNLQLALSAVAKPGGAPLALAFANVTLIKGQAATAAVGLGGETYTGTATIRARAVSGSTVGSAVGEQDLQILPP